MRFEHVSILGLGVVDAPIVVSSSDIEARLRPTSERLGLNPALLSSLTGIVSRRYWEEGVQPSDVASRAAVRAIENAGIDRSKIGVVINTSVCQDFIEPSVSAIVHGNLRLTPDCMNFDVRNACLGFMNGMLIAGNMIERGQIEYALIVDGEDARLAVESTIARLSDPSTTKEKFREQFATLTLGSSAVAMVLARTERCEGRGHAMNGAVSKAATQHNRLCVGQPDEMKTDASALLMAGLEIAGNTWAAAQEQLGWTQNNLDAICIHQISGAHTTKFTEALSLDPRKLYKSYPEFGNIGPAGVPVVLHKSVETGLVKKGARVALMGIGSGVNCMMMDILW